LKRSRPEVAEEGGSGMCVETCTPVRVIADPYTDYVPPDHLRDFDEEKRITRVCMVISAELPDGLLVHDDVLVVPEGVSEELKERMLRYGPYLRWAAGKEANAWLPGGPANFPEDD
jgi:hypothetical protein